MGFTLIELIAVIVLSSFVFLTLAQGVLLTIRSWNIALSGTKLVGQNETAFSRMNREIRQIRNIDSLVSATSSQISFYDVNSSLITYQLSGNQLMRNQKAAIDDVDSFQIQYLDKNESIIATPIVSPQSTNVRAVRITMTVSPSDQPMVLKSLTRFRNVIWIP